jgi:hypothetical protein
MRYYEPLWVKIKQDKVVAITASRKMHPRIVKAVIKEKYGDLGFKMEISPSHAILTHSRKHSVLTFTLTIHTHLSNITENML